MQRIHYDWNTIGAKPETVKAVRRMHHLNRMKEFAKNKLNQMLELEQQVKYEMSKKRRTDPECQLFDLTF